MVPAGLWRAILSLVWREPRLLPEHQHHEYENYEHHQYYEQLLQHESARRRILRKERHLADAALCQPAQCIHGGFTQHAAARTASGCECGQTFARRFA